MMEKLPWDAAAYDGVSTVQEEWGRRMLAGLDLRGDETVLDAGCGPGRLTALLAEAVPVGRVLAVDVSDEMLAHARARLAPYQRSSLLQADLAALPLAGAVDVIFSNAVFHWLPDHDRLFRSLASGLKPRGRLIAQCGGSGNLERSHAAALAVTAHPRFAPFFQAWKTPWVFATPKATERRLRVAGFDEINVSLTPAPTPFPSRQAFQDFVATVVLRPFLGVLPADLRPIFVEAFVNLQPDYELDYVRLNIEARRALTI